MWNYLYIEMQPDFWSGLNNCFLRNVESFLYRDVSTFLEKTINGRVWKPWPRRAVAPKSPAPEIYFSFQEALRGVIPYFFSLCHLQIVLLTIANKKIHYFSRNNDFNCELTCVRGMKAPAAPCYATCVSGSLPYFFNSLLLEHLSGVHFY